MTVDTNPVKIDLLLSRSVKEILPDKASLRARMLSGERLRIYIGTDATGTSLHLGHSTNYLVLERFRELGHEVIFLVGDFTSRIGDPTDKGDAARKQLSREEVINNTKTWLAQVAPIIKINDPDNPVKVMYNHEWLASLNFEDIIGLASHFTVQQMIERDMFDKRLKDNKPLYLHELFYPLMQGYDSVVMDVDVELCGSDQTFNALAGRTLQKRLKNKDKFVFVTNLLENPKTGDKMMSKSLGTGVYLDFDAITMYGSVMSQPDENMRQLFVDCTRLSLAEIETIFDSEVNPRDTKMRLAFEITKLYHGESGAQVGASHFTKTFQQKLVPEEVIDIVEPYLDTLLSHEVVASRSELRRLLVSGGVREVESGDKLSELPTKVSVPLVLRIGKRRFVKLLPKTD
jgi:tyrosyl-tRNA synthetase